MIAFSSSFFRLIYRSVELSTLWAAKRDQGVQRAHIDMLPLRIGLPLARRALPNSASAARAGFRAGVTSSHLNPLQSRARHLASEAVAQNAPKLGAAEVSRSLFAPLDTFKRRHLGPREADVQTMLQSLGYSDLQQFIGDVVPKTIALDMSTDSPDFMRPLSENELLRRGDEIADQNLVFKSLIGMGYHNTLVPPVIARNVSQSNVSPLRHMCTPFLT